MELLNQNLITQTINYHGAQLQKIWESERGEQDLLRHGIRDINFDVYNKRSKHLSFQDRGKRLKLQQFIVKNANVLYSQDVLDSKSNILEEPIVSEDLYAVMPPLEMYLNVDKQLRLKYFFENVKIGDLILGSIVSKTQSGMMLKVLCTTGTGANVRYVADINVKAFCSVANIIPAVDRKGVSRSYMMNDSVCCEVLEVIPDTDKMVCGMKGTTRQPDDPEHRPALGLINADDFPLVYKIAERLLRNISKESLQKLKNQNGDVNTRLSNFLYSRKAMENKNESYEQVLEKSVGFNNPNNISYLSSLMGIDNHLSLMNGLRNGFPEKECAAELRQQQASKWAYSNVADGIEHFKAGRHTEAFQCLNKALAIDPRNVEGLVARGALYANSGNFQKAIEDFEMALKINPSHANARKYMGETLVALGRSFEEENKIEEAKKAYQSCLSIIPYHEEAQNSLEFLKNKAQGNKNTLEPPELILPTLGSLKKDDLLKSEHDEKKDKKKKKKSKKRKNRHRSSSSSSSSSSGSDSSSTSSSSSSDSSSSSGDSDFKKPKKHRSRSRRREKQNSLSPLSKRMALMDPTHDTSASYQFNKPNSSFEFAFEQVQEPKKEDDYETKVRAFLEQTKGDSDYEEKVRKFLEESSKWKKDKQKGDEKKKKKKDKKKKNKENKKKRKDKKLRRKLDDYELLKKELGFKDKDKKNKKHGLTSDDEDYILQKVGYSKRFLDSLPDLEELESKLNAYYALEKDTKRSERSDSPKRIPIVDSPSPTREQKARQAVAEATASATASGAPTKWKMQIGSTQATTSGSRFKRKPEREEWPEEVVIDKRINKSSESRERESPKKPVPEPASDKNMSIRKAMAAMKEPLSKKAEMARNKIATPVQPAKPIPQGQVVLDKFGNFRLVTPPKDPRHEEAGRKPPEPPGRPRSGSRSSRRSRSRSADKYSRSRSSSLSRSRSRSYRSRSRSYYSRSHSRSGSYYSRSRSRSRSYSLERRRFRRGGFRGRFNDRGTYYKPRFQNPRRGGRGGFDNRYNRFERDYRGRGPRRHPYDNRGGRRPRGRFGRGGYRDYRDRRYDRSRSRDRSRSYSSRDSPEPNKKVEQKEKINKYDDGENQHVKHDGPLSEGEDRDDYTTEKFGEKGRDRDSFDGGKWEDGEREGNKESVRDENNA